MQPATKEMMLDKLCEIRNEVGCIRHAVIKKPFAGSGHVRRLTEQVSRIEYVLSSLIESL